ncbi:ovochymase-2-like [Temnothorax nylanderi]|uniref:ovochymase-2-like n=1 Tax=Temnothorax nylanderi TaxID=102681 RepID=UPI003A8A2E18
MAKICILIALLPQLLYTLVQGQESPCPQYFTYITKLGTDETIGQIEIQSPPRTGELHLKVTLKVAAQLPTRYVGRLELARSKEESAAAVQQGRHLSYHVYFPLRHPIPTLSGIWFNGERYCSGRDVTGSIMTTITLEHTLYLPNVLSQNFLPSRQNSKPTPRPSFERNTPKRSTTLSEGIGNNVFLNIIPSQSPPQYNNNNNVFLRPTPAQQASQHNNNNNNNIFLRPTPTNMYNNIFLRPTPAQPVPQPAPQPAPQPDNNNNNNNNNNDNNYNECGISGRSGGTNLLIANGQRTLPGQWPWLAALFVVRNGYEFQCAGSVLTTRHVLTAAHCLKLSSTSNDTLHPNVLEVALGRFNLRRFREEGTVNREIASYKIHPEYAHTTTGDSDLAILILRTPVEFSPFIRPICLWSQSTNLQGVENRVGYVVGWGRDEHGHRYTEEPRMAMMPIVSLENCHWSYQGFVSLTSNRTFCAGMQDGTGPCNGDSGSGLVLFNATTGRYQLRGVVSRSVLGNEPLCDLTKFTVFVDVAKYQFWILQQISTYMFINYNIFLVCNRISRDMAKIFILIAFLLQLCTTIQGLCPCPPYYSCTSKPGTNDEILGQIKIPSPPKNARYNLRVGFNTNPLIHKNEPVARLEIEQPVEEANQTVQQDRPLLYHVHFPLRQAIPRLTKIWFNDEQLCPNSETGNFTTTVEVVYPSGEVLLPSLNIPPHYNSSVTENSSPTADLPRDDNDLIKDFLTVQAQKPAQYNNTNNNTNNNNNECGIDIYNNNRPNLLISRGEETMEGQWPWLVALFVVRLDHVFTCGGTILTNRHVITAAHCLKLSWRSNDTLPPTVLEVALGRFRLREWHEPESVNREVASFKIHPEYAHTINGDSDLAILTLRTPVEFSLFIKPICLWSGSTDLQNVIGRTGYVVGWGQDEHGHHYTDKPRMASVPIVSQETCLWSHRFFHALTSKKGTFCAGLRDNSGPCNGDSGSGLVLVDSTTGRYYLRGIVSRSLLDSSFKCDLSNYVVYVDVAKYTPWIQEQISTT